ncbi:growth arrest specific 2 [Echinococcus multilocularis]|uniref:Growth arrest specific 2 n=1 Tax=Echinococcus multilocularis TaxID=6211 RepID=A0A068YGQ0_ECHMU|nr:growth arrest specific 2 [Echinococcus multilocularis]
MTRNSQLETRACSLPPENLVVTSGYSPLKNNQNVKAEHLYQKNQNNLTTGGKMRMPNSVDLSLAEDTYPGCSDYDPCSPASIDVGNGNNKHSPSDCSSAFTDEDSGCQVFYFGNALRVVSKCRMGRACSVSALDSPSVQPFSNKDEFLAAMTEDLADWMSRLYPDIAKDLDAEIFFDRISDGVLLCHHATELHRLLEREFPVSLQNGERRLEGVQIGGVKPVLPPNPPTFQSRGFNAVNLAGGSFWARDNVANFIQWCRAMRLPDCILFETEDLVSRKNLRSVIVCLLELARLGGRVGMEVPEIIYLEKEIDNEIALVDQDFGSDHGTNTVDVPSYDWTGDTQELENKTINVSIGTETEANTLESSTEAPLSKIPLSVKSTEKRTNKAALLREKKAKEELEERKRQEALKAKQQEEEELKNKKSQYKRPVIDMRTLDEIVREKLSQCTCEQTFPMIRLSEGRYLFGDKSTQIFVRILRSHVMVRVGGGWDTLDHFLQKYDECRKVQQPNSPSTTDKRFQFKKEHSRSTEEAVLDTTNTASLVSAVSGNRKQSVGMGEVHGPLLGEGNLQVTKKGREVVYTTAEVIHKSSSKCNLAHNCSKVVEGSVKSERNERGSEVKQLSSTSSIEDVALTPVISQTTDKPQLAKISKTCLTDQIDNFIQIKEAQKETLFAQNEESNAAVLASTTSSIEDLPLIPVIDQVVSGFDAEVKPLTIKEPTLDETPVKARLKPNPLPSPYKPGPNSVTHRISSSSSAYSINRQKATSTHNLALIENAPKPNLGKFSRSTVSLSGPFSVKRTAKPTGTQSSRITTLNADKRAKSTSHLAPAPSAGTRTRQDVDSSKMNVWERLSSNVPRNPTAPKIVSPPATSLKRQQPQQNHFHTEINQTSNVKRRNSVTTTKKVVPPEDESGVVKASTPTAKPDRESQKVAPPTRSVQTRRASVARVPAEGSRIPRPSKVPTISATRSKSVGSNLQAKRASPT